MTDACIEPRHYPMPEPPTRLTADPRLHDYDHPDPCIMAQHETIAVVARHAVEIEEMAVICERGHVSWAILCGVDDVAHCAPDCRRIAFAIDGAGVAFINLYERLHAAQSERIPA